MELKWLWVVVVLSVLSLEAGWSNGCWEQERLALLQLKPFFADLRIRQSNWTEEEGSDCCHWERVECNITTKRVTKLFLNFSNTYTDLRQKWYLNASLFLPFQELRSLYLNRNQIAGCVENEGFGKLSKLRDLEILELSSNFFNDSTLSSLSKISSLKSLTLAPNNHPTGSVHTNEDFKWLSGLSGLETLDLSKNNLTNGVFLYLDGLSFLRTLTLSFNNLEGTVRIQDFNNLKKLVLHNNRIERLRSSNGNGRQLRLVNLEELDLSYNLFNNSILGEISGFSNLKSLNLRSNQLKGSIDFNEFSALRNLETLDMSYNEVNRFATSKEYRYLRLKILYLDNVSTKQSFSPVSLLEPFSSIKTLFLRDNSYLNETIVSQELHVLRNVEDLILDNTPLGNNFLQSLGSLTSLKILSLYNCSLAGTLPAQGWCYLKGLEELNLNGNALGGIIPSCLGDLTFLRFLDISNNEFTGNVDSTPITNLTRLRYLSLSNNNFKVSLSFKSLANHSDLKFLFYDGNQLVVEPDFHTWSPNFQLKVFTLSNCSISGKRRKELPNFLYYQYDLIYIDLSRTNFGGIRFPDWLVENNTRLEQLFMLNSSILGPLLLPSHPNSNLKAIDISNNKMQQEILPKFCSLFPNLEWLNTSQNSFKCNIPPCLGEMRYLDVLDLSYNQFFGGIPEELALSDSLWYLRLSQNNLTGQAFPAVYRSRILDVLYLDGNNFDGEIPHFSPISSAYLKVLDLSHNHLSGKLPRWLGEKPMMWILSLANNRFKGPIPMTLCNLDLLRFLDLSQNNLSGNIPSFLNLHNLRHLHLRKNKLGGPLPHAFDGNSSLVTLDLSENNFTGNIPDWMGTLPALSVLILKANQFHGEFPMHLCKLYSLSIIDLSQNRLSGSIPSCVGSLTLKQRVEKSNTTIVVVAFEMFDNLLANMGLKTYDLISGKEENSKNGFDKTRWYPYSYAKEVVAFSTKSAARNYTGNILVMFSAIDLSCNQLTGIIPPGLGNLSEVHALNLSHNNLTGLIPSTFSQLKQVESLDLSYNNLNGGIPPQLTELNTLEVFSVAHNNLSGPLPDRKAQFGTFEESSYEGNPLLCGSPLKNSCSEVDSPETPSASSSGEQDGFIDMGVFYISFAVSYGILFLGTVIVLYINPYWRRVWFYFIEECSTTCYFFIVDGLRRLPCFRRNI